MNRCLLGFACLAMPLLAPAQEWVNPTVGLRKGEIDHHRAVALAERFVAKLGMPAADFGKGRAVLNKDPGRPERYWILSSDRYLVEVTAGRGHVKAFSNRERMDQQNRGRGRTGARPYSEAQARAHVERIRRLIGVPTEATLAGFSYKLDGQVRDQNSTGYFGATYVLDGRAVATISCDMQDGAVVNISLTYK